MAKPNQMLISLKEISKYEMETHAQMKSDSKEEITKQKQITKQNKKPQTGTGTPFCSKWFANTPEENLWPGDLNYACWSPTDIFTVQQSMLIVPTVLSFLSNELIASN